MAVPERFTGAVRPRPGEPLWVVHGVGVGDLVVGADLRVRPVEEMLWEILHAAGYERITFSSYRDPVYFRDSASRELTRHTAATGPGPERRRTMHRFTGPLGNRMVLGAQPGDGSARLPAAALGLSPRAQNPAASDPQRLLALDSLMTQAAVRTAAVVQATETFLQNLQADSRRSFAEMIGRWTADQVGDRNTCVLLFSQPEFTDVVEFVRGQRYLPQLADRLTELAGRRAAPTIGRLGPPDEDELARLIQIMRLRHGLRIDDWRALGHLTRVMAAQAVPVRTWQPALRSLAERGQPLSVAALREDHLVEVEPPDSRDLWQRLDGTIGLRPVKDFLAEHRHALAADAALREHGLGSAGDPVSLHLVFAGNPGTGKTMVAGMVGELYRDLGMLRKGHVVDASVDDLVSPNVGETARLTRRKVEEALDGVLFIDEAYRLSDQRDGFGGDAIDVLLSEMETHRDRLVVIVAGYPGKIDQFVASNPGMPSRFPAANHIPFPDYTPAELHTILLGRLDEAGLTCAPDLVAALRTLTETMYRTRNETFGNARTMRELAMEVKRCWARRTRPTPGGPIEPATAADVPERYRNYLATAAPLGEVLAELNRLVGLHEVKKSIRELAAVLDLRKIQPKRASVAVAPHMLFVGSPGTGKTTVARLMGRALAGLGLLVRGHVVATTRADLVAEYVGQTALKTRQKVMEALDGVLFIDEAYDLARGPNDEFGTEAVTELVELMEQRQGRLVVIAAGYPGPMEAFLRRNDGLASRFTERIEFADYSVPELRQIFESMAEGEGYELAQGTQARAVRWLEARRELDGRRFGNARTVRRLLGMIERRLAVRLQRLPEAERREHSTVITPADAPDPDDVS